MRKVITEMCHAHYPIKLDIYLYLKTTNFLGGFFMKKKKNSMVYWSSAYYLQFVENLILYFSKIMKFGNI